MEEQSLEITGKTVEEAIEIATLELGVGRDGVAVDVVSHGRSGILGIGSEPAKVRVRRIDSNGIAGDALSIVSHLLKSLDVIAYLRGRKPFLSVEARTHFESVAQIAAGPSQGSMVLLRKLNKS